MSSRIMTSLKMHSLSAPPSIILFPVIRMLKMTFRKIQMDLFHQQKYRSKHLLCFSFMNLRADVFIHWYVVYILFIFFRYVIEIPPISPYIGRVNMKCHLLSQAPHLCCLNLTEVSLKNIHDFQIFTYYIKNICFDSFPVM